MAFTKNQGPEEHETNSDINGRYGRKKYGRMVRLFRDGYLSIAVYMNVYERKTFHDIVIYRKVRSNNSPDGYDYIRGANLKPTDLPVLQTLLEEAHSYLAANPAD